MERDDLNGAFSTLHKAAETAMNNQNAPPSEKEIVNAGLLILQQFCNDIHTIAESVKELRNARG